MVGKVGFWSDSLHGGQILVGLDIGRRKDGFDAIVQVPWLNNFVTSDIVNFMSGFHSQ